MFFSGLYKSFLDAINGLKTVWREERNFRIETTLSVFVLSFAAVFGYSLFEWALVIIAIVIMLSAEIVNTALEDLCNEVEPGYDVGIKKIKDAMASFALVSSFGAFILVSISLISHFLI